MKIKIQFPRFFALVFAFGVGLCLTEIRVGLAQDGATSAEITEQDPSGMSPQLQFSFDGEEWKSVLEWLAAEAELTLVVDTLPPGKFNLSDTRSYTPEQAIDIINSWLVTRDFVLVRNNNLLVLLNLENPVPPNLVREISTDQLPDMGDFEFARCTFTPKTLTTEQVKEEFQALLGDHGKLAVLPNTGRLVVTDMVLAVLIKVLIVVIIMI